MEKETALTIQNHQALSVYDRMADPMTAIDVMAKWFAASQMLGIKNQDQGRVVALTCMIEKITPLEFARTYDIIDNKPTKKSAAMLAEFQRRGGRFKWIERTAEKCSAIAAHPQYCPDGLGLEVTLKELVDAGVATTWDKDSQKLILKSNYKKSPRQMLSWRVAAELIRAIDPEINAGLYAPEELDDMPSVDMPAVASTVIDNAKIVEPEEKKIEEKPAQTQKTVDNRAQKAISKFKAFGVLQDDLECYLGGDEPLPADRWSADDLAKLLTLYKELDNLPDEERPGRVIEMFGLEPGAMG